MEMTQYLVDIRHAVAVTLPAIWADFGELEALTEEVRRLTAQTYAGYARVDSMLGVDPDDEDGTATAQHWDTYFGVDKERFYKDKSLKELQQGVDLKRFSLNVLSGAVLQIGKQAISIVYGDLQASAPGRPIGSQPLKNVIWQARNQAMHWEEGRLSQPVQDCFTKLAVEFDQKFANYRTENMALDVVRLLDWRTFEKFSVDMMSLSP